MVVAAVTELPGEVMHIELVDESGAPLAPYSPGSHVIVTAGERRNAYSLTGADLNPRRYAISVLRKPGGGSEWLHDNVEVGFRLTVEGPRCSFEPVADQQHALLVAGGIGVTPVLSHARGLHRAGVGADIVYSYRPGHTAHLDDLRDLARVAGFSLFEATTIDDTRAVLEARLADQPLGTYAYACGPPAMLETYFELAKAAGWPPQRVLCERFTAPESDPGDAFEVFVNSTGKALTVPRGVSLLQTLLDAGIDVANMCRQGVCGECLIPVRSGSIEHRDYVLADDERAAGNVMISCVSRGTDLVLDV